MTPGAPDAEVLRRHLLAIDEAVQRLRKHRGMTPELLRADPERLWAVERGLQLCAQNALDVATHLAASSGRDVPDYATAIDRLSELAILPEDFATFSRYVSDHLSTVE